MSEFFNRLYSRRFRWEYSTTQNIIKYEVRMEQLIGVGGGRALPLDLLHLPL